MILVTGGAGFIGSHICRYLLNKGENVVVFDSVDAENRKIAETLRLNDIKDKISFVQGDIRDIESIKKAINDHGIKKIIHTAAITFVPFAIKNPALTFKVNVEGSFNVLEAARLLNLEKVLYVSTSSVYGDFQKEIADETHPLSPKEIYGASKLAAERIAMSYFKTYGMNVCITRTTSVYGPGDLENRAGKIFIENALTGKEITLEGGGRQKRDFSYVKDVAAGISECLLSGKTTGEVLHVSGGGDYTVRDMANIVARYVPNAKIVETPARKIDVTRGRMDISKIKNMVGYEPKFDLERGVRDYVSWMHSVYAPFFSLPVVNKPVI